MTDSNIRPEKYKALFNLSGVTECVCVCVRVCFDNNVETIVGIKKANNCTWKWQHTSWKLCLSLYFIRLNMAIVSFYVLSSSLLVGTEKNRSFKSRGSHFASPNQIMFEQCSKIYKNKHSSPYNFEVCLEHSTHQCHHNLCYWSVLLIL